MPKNKSILSLSKKSLKRRFTNTHLNLLEQPLTSELTIYNVNNFISNSSATFHENDSEELNQSFLSDFSSTHDTIFDAIDDNWTEVLRDIILEYDFNRTGVTVLLKFLNSHGHPYLPMDSRTLLETPRCRDVIDVAPGTYVHIGIRAGLEWTLSNLISPPENLSLDINIDGVPISRSSGSCFWIILGRLFAHPLPYPFPIGIYHGPSKPTNFAAFLRPFVDEAKELESENITIRCFICDAPARSCICGTKQFNGKSGCGRCTQPGVSINRRMTFPQTDAPLRTDQSFRAKIDTEYNIKESPLMELKLNMTNQFVIDTMHAVFLGVQKKLLKLWCLSSGKLQKVPLCVSVIKKPVKAKKNKKHLTQSQANNIKNTPNKHKLSQVKIDLLSERMIQASHTQPIEFQRRSRGIKDLAFFKATELRTFLLFTGPIVLKGIISDLQYEHFLLLHIAMKILMKKQFYEQRHVAQELLIKFVENMGAIYGKHTVVYNVHSLIHIIEDVENFGDLESIDAFAFESFNGLIKRKLHKNNNSLAEICNRIAEMYKFQSKKYMQKPIHQSIVLKEKRTFNNGRILYNKIIVRGTTFKSDQKNQYLLTASNQILNFEYAQIINGKTKVGVKEFEDKTDFYNVPVRSSVFNIFKTTQNLSTQFFIDPDTITCKLFRMNFEESIIFFPLHDIKQI
jgi:hypothetical protein